MEQFVPQYLPDAVSVYRKKEFYEDRLTTETGREFTDDKDRPLLKYQQLVSRLVGQYTQFNSMLLFHEMGAGKTRSAIATVELARQQSIRPLKKTLVLLKNKALINKFIRELVTKAYPDIYDPDPADPLTREILKKVKRNYDIFTFISFANKLEKDMDSLVNTFSHSIIIIDEVQQLVGERGGNDPYTLIHTFLHRVVDSKILLMSGTPMKDTPDQFAMVMNLILDKQLPTGKKFRSAFFEDLYLTENGKRELKDAIRNKVSYLSPPSNVPIQFIGEGLPGSTVNFLRISYNYMSDFQNSVYSKVARANVSVNDFNRPDRYASDFVFPDGSFGKGVLKYTRKFGDKLGLEPTFKKLLLGRNDEETLRNLQTYSCKYAAIIRTILENPEDLCFVYSEYVGQGGIILFSLLMQELFGFDVAKNVKYTEKKRCALITGDMEASRINSILTDMVNTPKNMTGKICRVVIGSRVLAIGHDLLNVRQVHIVTPHWNFSETDQIIARAKRFDGNKALKDAGLSDVLKIYLHAAVSKTVKSVDVEIWKIAESKDFVLKQIDRAVKEVAIDCGFNYSVNYHPNSGDGSRDCNYQECFYECDGLGIPQELGDDELDKSTYNLLYDAPDVEDVVQNVITDLNSASADVFTTSQNSYLVSKSMAKVYNTSKSVASKYGLDGYPRTDGSHFFITDTPTAKIDSSLDMNWYSRHPILEKRNTLNSVLRNLPIITERVDATLITLEYVSTVNDTVDLINKLPSWLKDDIIMRAWTGFINGIKGQWSTAKIKKVSADSVENRIVLATLKSVTISPTTIVYVDSEDVKWTYAKGSKAWVVKTAKEQTEDIQETIRPYREKSIEDGINYFGILDKEYTDVNSLKIVDSVNLRSLGRHCGSYTKPTLLRLVMLFDIKPTENLGYIEDMPITKIKERIKTKDSIMEESSDLLKGASTHALKNVLWWSETKKLNEKLCPLLTEEFDRRGLLVTV